MSSRRKNRFLIAACAAALSTAIAGMALAAPSLPGSASPVTRDLVPLAPFERAALATRNRIAEASRERFPVRGPFNFGQGGAQFGASRPGRVHAGQDVMARTGTPMVSVSAGRVLETGDDGGRGNYVVIFDRDSRRSYVYLHLDSKPRVRAGEKVSAGERIGAVGCTGSCFGPHLHFEIRRGRGANGPPIDPRRPLARWAKADRIGATLAPGQG